ncbi:MAG: Fusaric acid resistance protein conserved region [Rubritepida sp.]|nr:Fusaric acid resistance protein conserved region [Rubritepida sp.]
MTMPTGRDWLFSIKAFIAAMLALYIALAWDLPRPYWAMTTVYVVMNPLSGATASKAIYRTCGTLLGAIAAVVLVPNLVDAPELLAFAVALWAGCLMYISLLHRTPRSYVFMLAGYTLPLIALPAVLVPETIFDVATARSQEIILGIVCASVVSAIVFPVSIGPVLGGRVSAWLRDAGAWAQEILRGLGTAPASPAARQRLAADIAALDMLISQLSYDAEASDTANRARELRGRLLMLLPILSSLADRLHALRLEIGLSSPELRALTQDIADWMGSDGGASPQALLDRLTALEPPIEEMRQWEGLVRSSLIARLKELVGLWRDCLAQQREIASGEREAPRKPGFRGRPLIGGNRHYDHLLMAYSAGSTVLATFLAGLLWIQSGWAGGANFMAITAVACCFFGALDKPVPAMMSMLIWTGVALSGAGIYLFTVLPHVHDFEMLAMTLAPALLLVGLLMPRPQFFLGMMLVAANGTGSLALQSRYNIEFSGFVNEGLAVMGGVLFALVWTSVAKPFGAEIAARRLVRSGWRDLAAMAAGTGPRDHAALAARTLDRLGQLAPRLAANEARHFAEIDGLAELRIGYNVLDLQRDRRILPEEARGPVGAVLEQVSSHFRARLTGAEANPPAALLAGIDEALTATTSQSDSPATRDAALALVGLRRGLFPGAPGPGQADPMHALAAAAE